MKKSSLITLIALAAITIFLSWWIYVPSNSFVYIYSSLNQEDTIVFEGDHILYNNEKIVLGEKAFFVDGNLPNRVVKRHPFVYNSFNEAMKDIREGSPEEAMTLYIAPYVYWIDDPDDPSERVGENGGIPYGLVINESNLHFYGLSKDPQHVVLACNRGQTQGAVGNFTMFRFNGNNIRCENLTMGNYCNVDLVYPLKTSLNRTKRSSAITQAQLALCNNSDKIFASNCAFISRLNTCPFVGSKRAFFVDCRFESTDDALCGNGVYLNCDLDFYSSKPFWSTHGTGAAFLNCDFNVITRNAQYLTKVGSQVALVDCRFKNNGDSLYLGWTQYPKDHMRCYQYNVSLNGRAVLFQSDRPHLTVDMLDQEVLKAYRFEYEDKLIYNTYNLLRGDDDWDPQNIKDIVAAASQQDDFDYSTVPVQLSVIPQFVEVQTGKKADTLFFAVKRFGDIPVEETVKWSINSEDAPYLYIRKLKNGNCLLTGSNRGDQIRTVVVEARHSSGLRGASVVRVLPNILPAPIFTKKPVLSAPDQGVIKLSYSLNLQHRADHSLITWYRCKDARGSEAIPVAVSRLNQPEYRYNLSAGDVGYYLQAKIEPKHIRSHPGAAFTVCSAEPVTKEDVLNAQIITTDFQNFPADTQKQILPGFWTVDAFKPADTEAYHWQANSEGAWFYGTAEGGANGTGFLQGQRGARLLYTPVDGNYGNMGVNIIADPCKTAGQGFGSATGQYMDIYIKFDTKSLSGYGLRIVRTPKYANAVDFVLMEYNNGVSREISEAISATCFLTNCSIKLATEGNLLKADISTTTPKPYESNPDLPHEVKLTAEITENNFGGSGIQHTGSAGGGATMLHKMEIIYQEQP